MASKGLLYAIGAVVLVYAGAIVVSSSFQPRDFECKEKEDCRVPIGQKFWFADLEVAERVTVKTPATLTFKIEVGAFSHIHFHPNKGIVFADPRFDCKRDASNDRVYVCLDTAPPGSYKYTITTQGIGSRDKDPFVVNN